MIKSRKTKLWPVMLLPIEITKHLRSQFLIVVQIWFDKCNPSMNNYLQPLCVKLRECFREGISWVHPKTGVKHVTKITVPLIIGDAPARADVLNMHNHNGRYGCNICEIKTKKCANITPGKKRIRIYPFQENLILRTNERIREQEKKALRKDKVIRGIKGQSIISALPRVSKSTCVILSLWEMFTVLQNSWFFRMESGV